MTRSVLVAVVLVLVAAGELAAQAPSDRGPQRIDAAGLPNAFRMADSVISGGQPEGDLGFAELKKLGVRTVISVDGAKPDVAAAKAHGLRYVHLPHGYDGIPGERLLDLAQAVRDLPGPVYIHCHHGKHRSPAAAAAACVALGLISPEEGLAALNAAGADAGYRGLFRTVREARPVDAKILDSRNAAFREVVEPAAMVESMIEIEHAHDHLKHAMQAGWKAPPSNPDVDPPHEALILREHFTELLRTEEVASQTKEFIALMRQSEANAAALENALRRGDKPAAEVTVLFERITADCRSCHRAFRDVPIQEKAAR